MKSKDHISDVYSLIIAVCVELAFFKIIRPIVSDEIIEPLFISTTIFITLLCIINKKTIVVIFVISMGLLLRIILMIFDNYTLLLTYFNRDSLEYFIAGSAIASGYGGRNVYGGSFSRFLGLILSCVGSSRPIAEITSIVISICFIFTVISTSKLLELPERSQRNVLIMATFFPYAVYNGVATYREGIIMLLTSLSFYYLIKWAIHKQVNLALLSVIYLALASIFHAGVVIMLIGYGIIFAFYNKRTGRLQFRRDTFFMILLISIGIVIITILYPQLFLSKFLKVASNPKRLLRQFNYAYGGSRYLTWINANSVTQVVLFSPIKAIYFAFSPMPLDWRGIKDIVAFMVDSVFYLTFFYNSIKYMNNSHHSPVLSMLLLSIVTTFFVFGIGTWTAGTAMRHRCKLFGIMLPLNALLSSIRDQNQRKSSIWNWL